MPATRRLWISGDDDQRLNTPGHADRHACSASTRNADHDVDGDHGGSYIDPEERD